MSYIDIQQNGYRLCLDLEHSGSLYQEVANEERQAYLAFMQVYELSNAVAKAQKALEEAPAGPCEDENELCSGWAERGECEKNPTYMAVSCRASCKHCKKLQEAPGKQAPGNKTVQGDQAVVTKAHTGCAPSLFLTALHHALCSLLGLVGLPFAMSPVPTLRRDA